MLNLPTKFKYQSESSPDSDNFLDYKINANIILIWKLFHSLCAYICIQIQILIVQTIINPSLNISFQIQFSIHISTASIKSCNARGSSSVSQPRTKKNPSTLWDIMAAIVASSIAIWVVTFHPFSHELTSQSAYNIFRTLNVAPNGPTMRKFLINNDRVEGKSISRHIRCHNNLLSAMSEWEANKKKNNIVFQRRN